MSDLTKLSSSTTVARYRELEASNSREEIGKFLIERFDERYFRPIEDSPSRHGFAALAISCLVIETLESFYQGRPDTRNASAQMFREFFGRDTPLKPLGEGDWFYRDIRCGILHQSESRGGWKVRQKGKLVDSKEKAINASAILRSLKRAVAQYAENIRTDDELWKNLKKKMHAVCSNCY